MGDDADAVSFPFLGFSGRPVERVQDVLTKGGEEPISHLEEGRGDRQPVSLFGSTQNLQLVARSRYLQHVVDDVEFDDGLASDQVVHHGVVQVVGHGEGQQQDQGLQDVAHVRWLQKTRATGHTQNNAFKLANIAVHMKTQAEKVDGVNIPVQSSPVQSLGMGNMLSSSF